mmetsp:Transcript_41035/g.55923  ORF Transcript_41035/g.55923 Transcript_41035/m.55923 type:complete len:334 (-) Transcript_41035:258-1259(-)
MRYFYAAAAFLSLSTAFQAGPCPFPSLPSTSKTKNIHGAIARSPGQVLEQFDVSTIRCPFFRRRASDLIDSAALCGRWLASRHKSLDLSFGLLPLSTFASNHQRERVKVVDATLDELMMRLSKDFSERQCQVTGRLSDAYFSEDCVFDGPDPDMPVWGLRKYLSASKHLFHHAASCCQLIAVATVPCRQSEEKADDADGGGEPDILIVWRIEGALSLPWKPTIKPYTGCTIFRREKGREGGGLIASVKEYWSISAADAFLSTVLKEGFGDPAAPSAVDLISGVKTVGIGHVLKGIRDLPQDVVSSAVCIAPTPTPRRRSAGGGGGGALGLSTN